MRKKHHLSKGKNTGNFVVSAGKHQRIRSQAFFFQHFCLHDKSGTDSFLVDVVVCWKCFRILHMKQSTAGHSTSSHPAALADPKFPGQKKGKQTAKHKSITCNLSCGLAISWNSYCFGTDFGLSEREVINHNRKGFSNRRPSLPMVCLRFNIHLASLIRCCLQSPANQQNFCQHHTPCLSGVGHNLPHTLCFDKWFGFQCGPRPQNDIANLNLASQTNTISIFGKQYFVQHHSHVT